MSNEDEFLNGIIELTMKYDKDFEPIKRKGWIGPIVVGEKVKVITVDKYVTHKQLKAMNYVTMDKLKAMNYVTMDKLKAMNYVTMDKLKAMNYVTKDYVDKRFEQVDERFNSLEQKVDLILSKLS